MYQADQSTGRFKNKFTQQRSAKTIKEDHTDIIWHIPEHCSCTDRSINTLLVLYLPVSLCLLLWVSVEVTGVHQSFSWSSKHISLWVWYVQELFKQILCYSRKLVSSTFNISSFATLFPTNKLPWICSLFCFD